ncbi:hypothetical protein [Parvicella tangerina]|nr:hypothetical protein [Parvicella tangerina]
MLNRNILTFFTVLWTMTYFGQDQNSSPYTRFGIGEQVPMITSPYIGLGGSSVALAKEGDLTQVRLAEFHHINVSNPATYASVLKHTPVFDCGVMGKASFMKSDKGTYNQTTVALRNFALLLPVAKKTGVVFGLMPYSTTGYDINEFDPNEGDTITYNYAGMGSVNRLFIGAGQQLINRGDSIRLSIGVNASFLFGTIQRDRKIEFQDATFYNSHVKNKLLIRGFSMDYGLHYYERINKNISYQIGLTANLGNQVRAYQDFFAYTYTLNNIQEEEVSDTTNFYTDNRGHIKLPKSFAIGGAVTLKERVTLTAQFEMADFQNYYEYFDSTETAYEELAQMQKFAFGVNILPKKGMNFKDVHAIQLSSYQLGFHYGYTPYRSNDIHLKQYGIAFGITMPMLSSTSTSSLSLGFELGKLGTTENGLIEDNYLKFNVGLSLSPNAKYDRWFWKRLYD